MQAVERLLFFLVKDTRKSTVCNANFYHCLLPPLCDFPQVSITLIRACLDCTLRSHGKIWLL
uniref:Uncharacterized protein n=1 Tax=Anguilla anguilla TaxID=7936 RepID=A0A0E9XLM6_ANGAN